MATSTKYLSVQFGATSGKNVSLRISDPKQPDAFQQSEIVSALDNIVDSDVIAVRNSATETLDSLLNYKKVTFIETTRTALDVIS